MSKNRLANAAAAAAGFFFLCALPGLNRAQSSPSGPAPTPRGVPSAPGPKVDPGQTDDFAGLKFTDGQQVKIDEIRQDIKVRRDAVVKDERLNTTQKEAMLEGYRRLENVQVFEVLTPEQQIAVRKRSLARRAAERQQRPSQSK